MGRIKTSTQLTRPEPRHASRPVKFSVEAKRKHQQAENFLTFVIPLAVTFSCKPSIALRSTSSLDTKAGTPCSLGLARWLHSCSFLTPRVKMCRQGLFRETTEEFLHRV